jgi:hypothetical protein
MVNLVRNEEMLQVDTFLLAAALRLGRQYGWHAAGTLPPRDWQEDAYGDWDDIGHLEGFGELVTAGDAAELADALKRALDDIPDRNLVGHICRSRIHSKPTDALAWAKHLMGRPLPEIFSGTGKAWLSRLIVFLERGGCRMYFDCLYDEPDSTSSPPRREALE